MIGNWETRAFHNDGITLILAGQFTHTCMPGLQLGFPFQSLAGVIDKDDELMMKRETKQNLELSSCLCTTELMDEHAAAHAVQVHVCKEENLISQKGWMGTPVYVRRPFSFFHLHFDQLE